MKRILILISVITSVIVAISCKTQVEPTAQFAASKGDFSVTPSGTSITATASDSTNAVLTFTWTDPKYAMGLTNSSFTIYMAPTNTGFASFQSKSFTGVLTGSLLGKELNGMALKLGGKVGQTITLDVKVIAAQENNNEQKTSNVIQITYAPYGGVSLSASSTSVTATAAKSDSTADTLTWVVSRAFVGYNGVVGYQLQYAKGGTNFVSPVSTTVTALSQIYTQLDLNKIAIAAGVTPGGSGDVDFRVIATNELKDTVYSNVVTVNVTTYVAYNSIGIIGLATAGGWNTDTDMYRPDPINAPSNWTLTTYLTVSTDQGVKFRADDAWTTNWGGSDFPTGTATQGGGNIPISTAGWYQINFNAGTGAYSFTLLSTATYAHISLIGDFNSWGGDDDLTADASGHIWTGTLSLSTSSALKFRANHDWTNSWLGSNDGFPSGYALGSNNLTVPAGNYFVYFNDVSLEYFFASTDANADAATPYAQIGIIGDATPGGWSNDTYLIQDPTNPYKWSGKVTLTTWSDGAKFRANSGWATSWGGNDVPSGIGVLNGPNIPVIVGTAQITFNTATGQYSFTY